MNNKTTLRAMTIVLATLGAAGATYAQISNPFVSATASARYQGDDGGTDSHTVNFPVNNPPGSTSAHVLVPVGGATGYGRADRNTAYDDAEAFAQSTMPGVFGAYARSGGYSPGHMHTQDGVVSSATTVQYANWFATGPGNSADVDLAVLFDGWFYTSANAGLSADVFARVSLEMTLETNSGSTVLFSASATNNLQNGFSQTFMTADGSSDANWLASWTDTSSTLDSKNGKDFMWDLNYVEVFNNLVHIPINEVFATRVTMTVEAINNEGPFELFATTDFSHTGGVNLQTNNSDIHLEMVNLVPEPGTLVALMAACSAAAFRRRRR